MSPHGVKVDLLFASSGIEREISERALDVDLAGVGTVPVALVVTLQPFAACFILQEGPEWARSSSCSPSVRRHRPVQGSAHIETTQREQPDPPAPAAR